MTNQHPEFDAAPPTNVARGFALYAGVDEETAKAAGTSLAELVSALRAKVAELVPAAQDETYAAVALAPKNVGGKSVDIVRTALRDPRALDKLVSKVEEDEAAANKGILIDFSRKKVFANGENAELTYKEFELLRFLATHPSRVFTREQLLSEVWGYDYFGGTRTVDVHVRRLRAKLGDMEQIIGTVRNVGYRFNVSEEDHEKVSATS